MDEIVLFGNNDPQRAKNLGPSGYQTRNERQFTEIYRSLLVAAGRRARSICKQACCSVVSIRTLNLSGGSVRIPDFSFDFHCDKGESEEMRFKRYRQQWFADYKDINDF
jgi:hypothetical protein